MGWIVAAVVLVVLSSLVIWGFSRNAESEPDEVCGMVQARSALWLRAKPGESLGVGRYCYLHPDGTVSAVALGNSPEFVVEDVGPQGVLVTQRGPVVSEAHESCGELDVRIGDVFVINDRRPQRHHEVRVVGLASCNRVWIKHATTRRRTMVRAERLLSRRYAFVRRENA